MKIRALCNIGTDLLPEPLLQGAVLTVDNAVGHRLIGKNAAEQIVEPVPQAQPKATRKPTVADSDNEKKPDEKE